MATPERLPYQARLKDLQAITDAAQRDIAHQVIAALQRGDLYTARARRLQLSAVLSTLDQLGAHVLPMARDLVAQAWDQSAAAATTRIDRLRIQAPEIPGAFHSVSVEAVQALQDSIEAALRGSISTIGRQVGDIYATAGRRQGIRSLLGVEGSPQASARALALELQKDRDVARLIQSDSITGFVDKTGRRWSMSSYTEMATRTTTRQAAVQGAVARMASHGIALARVTEHASSCKICAPWEGRLVSLDGSVDEYNGEPVADLTQLPGGGPPMHPNCGHSLAPVSTRIEAIRLQLAGASA